MGRPMILKTGGQINLPPNATYTGGLGWDPRGGVGKSPDLDLWLLRKLSTGEQQVIAWCNRDWLRPDLGRNKENNPFIATPELDLIHKGDDRTGAESAEGYDENFDLDPAKAPTNVVGYTAFATIYDENDEGLTLGVAENIICGIKDDRGREVQVKLAEEYGFDVTVQLCSWTRDPGNGLWVMHGSQKGYDQRDMFDVAIKDFGVVFPQHWMN